jgi:hypothetical protein
MASYQYLLTSVEDGFLRRPPWLVGGHYRTQRRFPRRPTFESALHVSAGMTRLDQRSGFAHGTVTDRQDSVVAHGRRHVVHGVNGDGPAG